VITVHGLHHVKVPVSDLTRSRAWYETVLTVSPHLEFPDDNGTVHGIARANALGGGGSSTSSAATGSSCGSTLPNTTGRCQFTAGGSPHIPLPPGTASPGSRALLVRCGTQWLASLAFGDASRGRAQPPSRW
jgi:catechol 2,3-dioxygenase-like lactoylglutathione lyase family enzyme